MKKTDPHTLAVIVMARILNATTPDEMAGLTVLADGLQLAGVLKGS